MRTDEPYIKLLDLAATDLAKQERISFQAFTSRVEKELPEMNNNDIIRLWGEIYGPHADIGVTFFMSIDSYMRLMEYKEFKHSLENSRTARRDARNAILVTLVALVVQVVVQIITSGK